jgi:hypothetical protein
VATLSDGKIGIVKVDAILSDGVFGIVKVDATGWQHQMVNV